MSAQRPGPMLPESCGCRTPPSFPAKTLDSEEVSIRPSTTRRCLRRCGGIPTSSRGEVLVAEMDGRIVGCATIEDRGGELELVNIDVPLQLQGKGIGTILVRSVEERARAEGKQAVTAGTSMNAAGVAWKSHFPGGSTSGTASPTKRKTSGPGQSGRGSARYDCGKNS